MRQAYEVDLTSPDLFDVAALLISHLAWPARADCKQRSGLYLSVYAWCVRERAARDPSWGEQPQFIQPNAVCRAESDIARDIRTLERRVRDRLTAGHIAMAFLKETGLGATPKLPAGAKRLSLNQMIEHMDLGFSAVDNIAKRVWRPSLPVIHLCAAWASVQQEHWTALGARADLITSFQSPEVLAQIIHRAELYVPLLERGRLAVQADTLVRFGFARAGVKTNLVS